MPFGSRKLTGVIIDVHNNAPSTRYAIKEALKLVDEEPVLDEELLKLGAWIASYYCAPVGEVYRGMSNTPLFVTAAGLVCHGVLSLYEAKYRRLC